MRIRLPESLLRQRPRRLDNLRYGQSDLDQINIEIPRSLAGRGEVELLLLVDGQKANPVTLYIK